MITFTEKECRQWLKDKTHNPRTGRSINPNAANGVYKQLHTQCEVMGVKERTPQQKYCDCIMHVRVKTQPPYGICNKSVLKKHDVPQPKCVYNYENYRTEELQAYAEELASRKNNPLRLSDKATKGNRRALLSEIKAHVKAKEKTGKNVSKTR